MSEFSTLPASILLDYNKSQTIAQAKIGPLIDKQTLAGKSAQRQAEYDNKIGKANLLLMFGLFDRVMQCGAIMSCL